MVKRFLAGVGIVALLAFVTVPFAAAGNPNDTQYGNTASQVSSEEPPSTTSSEEPPSTTNSEETTIPVVQVSGKAASAGPTAAQGETLPFTGLDLGVVLAIGAAAVAGGLLLRRAGRKTGKS